MTGMMPARSASAPAARHPPRPAAVAVLARGLLQRRVSRDGRGARETDERDEREGGPDLMHEQRIGEQREVDRAEEHRADAEQHRRIRAPPQTRDRESADDPADGLGPDEEAVAGGV